jgi:hypothetical protein
MEQGHQGEDYPGHQKICFSVHERLGHVGVGFSSVLMYACAALAGDCCSHSWGVVILGGVKHKEKNYEGLVSHRSAVRSRDLRNDPDLSASNATWCRTERRWGEGHHLRARPSSSTAGGKT